MGQYYRIACCERDYANFDVYTPSVDGLGFIGNKLCEHAGFMGPVPNAVANLIYKNPLRVVWVGDYADNDEVENIIESSREEIFDMKAKKFSYYKFNYTSKYLINHDKKAYVSFAEYIINAEENPCVYCPVAMLTCVGNGLGGGDYCGNEKFVGEWAGDLISIDDEFPAGYEKIEVMFNEDF